MRGLVYLHAKMYDLYMLHTFIIRQIFQTNVMVNNIESFLLNWFCSDFPIRIHCITQNLLKSTRAQNFKIEMTNRAEEHSSAYLSNLIYGWKTSCLINLDEELFQNFIIQRRSIRPERPYKILWNWQPKSSLSKIFDSTALTPILLCIGFHTTGLNRIWRHRISFHLNFETNQYFRRYL